MAQTKIKNLTGMNLRALDTMSTLDLIPAPVDRDALTTRTYDGIDPASLARLIDSGRLAAGVDKSAAMSAHAVMRKLRAYAGENTRFVQVSA